MTMTRDGMAALLEGAACQDADPEIFFPVKSRKAVPPAAKLLCDACPVRQECYEYGLDAPMLHFGVYGGKSARAREKAVGYVRPAIYGVGHTTVTEAIADWPTASDETLAERLGVPLDTVTTGRARGAEPQDKPVAGKRRGCTAGHGTEFMRPNGRLRRCCSKCATTRRAASRARLTAAARA